VGLAVGAAAEEADAEGAAVEAGHRGGVGAPLGLGRQRARPRARLRKHQDAAVEGRGAGPRQRPAPAVKRDDLQGVGEHDRGSDMCSLDRGTDPRTTDLMINFLSFPCTPPLDWRWHSTPSS